MLPAFESVGFPLLNCDATHWWKVLELLSAMSLSHPELYIAKIRSQAANPKSEIWGMSRPSLLPRGLCLMKVAILWREHAMFLALPSKTSTVLNKEIELKLPSHSVGSAGWLARYGMAEGSRLGGGGDPRGLGPGVFVPCWGGGRVFGGGGGGTREVCAGGVCCRVRCDRLILIEGHVALREGGPVISLIHPRTLVGEIGCDVQFDVHTVLCKNALSIIDFRGRGRIHGGRGSTSRSSDTGAGRGSSPW